MAHSVPVRRLVRCVVSGFSMLYCRPYLSSCISCLLNFMLVRFFPWVELLLFNIAMWNFCLLSLFCLQKVQLFVEVDVVCFCLLS